MIKIDDNYVPEIGDVVKYNKLYCLVLGSSNNGNLYLYILYNYYVKDTDTFLFNMLNCAVESSLSETLCMNKLHKIRYLPLSIIYNYYKGIKELKYISSIDKNRVKSWVLKSRLVDSVILPELFSYYDILTEFCNKYRYNTVVSTDNFEQFCFYQYVKSNRIIFSLGVNSNYKVFLDLKCMDSSQINENFILNIVEKLQFKNTKVFMSSDIKNIRKLNIILSDSCKNQIKELVKVRGIVM